jgi:recombination protein RecT
MTNDKPQQGLMTLKSKNEALERHLQMRMVEIAKALPNDTMKPEHFARTVLTLCGKNTKLLDVVATTAGLASLLGAVMQAAQLGLAPDPVLGEAWFVPFKGIVQFIPGYKGLTKLAWQSGQVAKISARIVREGERFEIEYGLKEKLKHTPGDDPSKPMTHVYATITTHGSRDPLFVCLSRAEVDAIKKRSPAVRAGVSTPWDTDYEAMALKSAIRRVCKLAPMSTTNQSLQKALALDEQAEHGLKQNLGELLGMSTPDEEREQLLEAMEPPRTEQEKA